MREARCDGAHQFDISTRETRDAISGSKERDDSAQDCGDAKQIQSSERAAEPCVLSVCIVKLYNII